MSETGRKVSSAPDTLIRKLRKEAGYKTTRSFCDACHEVTKARGNECSLTIGTIGDYERGKHPVSRASAEVFAQVLHVRVDYILGLSDQKTEQDVLANFYTAVYSKDSGVLAILELHGYHLRSIYDIDTQQYIQDLIPININWMDERHIFIFTKDGQKEEILLTGFEWLRFHENVEATLIALFDKTLRINTHSKDAKDTAGNNSAGQQTI